MSRHRPSGSYGHYIRRIESDWFRIGWRVDRYYSDSRLRHPIMFNREVDEAGAKRFSARWKIPLPKEPT